MSKSGGSFPDYSKIKGGFLSMSMGSTESNIIVEEDNGLIFNDILIPEEIVHLILSYVDLSYILRCALVCKKWNEIVKSSHMWKIKCNQIKKITRKKKLPWYMYYALLDNFFDKNLVLNNCGQDGFKHWTIRTNGGDKWRVEDTPNGAENLPEAPEFKGLTSCFATSYQLCSKFQIISFKNSKLQQKILNEYKPKIYVSEWFAGRFDCGCEYELIVQLMGTNKILKAERSTRKRVEQWAGSTWTKIELSFEDYPKGVTEIHFYHKGNDTQFWKGHYGCKMAGASVKISFDSIAC